MPRPLGADPTWGFEALEQKWEEGYNHLKQYYEEYGNVLVPYGHKSPDGYKLGMWVSDQRKDRELLDPKSIARLDVIGFVWATLEHLEQKWEEAYKRLKQYYEKYGNVLVAKTYKSPDGYQLGNWVHTRRTARETMDPKRVARLDDLGFVWLFRTGKD